MAKALVFQRIVPHYRVALFRRLHRELGYIACFSREQKGASLSSADDEAFDFPVEKMGRIYFSPHSETLMVQNLWPVLMRHRPKLVVSECALGYLSMWALFLLRPFFGYRLVVWGHGVMNHELDRPLRGFKGWLLRRVYAASDGVLVYTEKRLHLLRPFLPEGKPAWPAHNSLDLEPYFELRRKWELRGKAELRAKLGFDPRAKFHLIWVGRLLQEKRLDLLLQSFARLRGKVSCQLHVVGGGPLLAGALAENPPGVKFYGPIYGEEETGELLFASDAFVMPGYLGLSVLHAFALAVPVISCEISRGSGPFHSPEADYLNPGENGLFFPSSDEEFAFGLENLLSNPSRLAALSEGARKTGERFGLGPMVAAFAAIQKKFQTP